MALRYANRVMVLGLAGAMSLAVSGPSVAQGDEDVQEFEAFEVTGSRIKRIDIEGATPVITLNRDDIERTGLQNIGDVLQDLSIAGSGLNTTVNNGGSGSTQIDLRNLGANRVLVLVNGRRWVRDTASFGSAVDLNTIPLSIVKSIDILKDGASAIYGSDAIAGVVNIKTVKDFTGGVTSAYYGAYDEGDGQTQNYSTTLGATTDQVSVVGDISFTRVDPVFAGDRDIAAVPVFGTGNARGSSGTPRGRFLFVPEAGSGNAPNNGPFVDVTLRPGENGQQRGDFDGFTANDRFNFAPFNYIATPSERTNLYAQFDARLADNINLNVLTFYQNRQSDQLLAPTPLFIGTLAGGSGGNVGIAADNRFNPFGQEIGVQNPGFVGRRMVEVGNRQFLQDLDTYYISPSVSGDFLLGNRYFNWDASYLYTRSETNQLTDGLLNIANVQQGLGPDSQCTGGCVPFNLFGGPGSITQAMVDYVTFTAQDRQVQDLTMYSVNFSAANLFELPAGPMGLAVGAEYREEFGRDTPDALIAAGLSSGNIRQPTGGEYDVREFFGEVSLPLVADLPGINLLNASIAGRYSDYSNFGSETTSKFTLEYRPYEDLLVRGTFAESFRAPSVQELFLGNSDSFPSVTDPCSDLNNAPNNTVRTNCVAQGVPANGSYQQINNQILTTVGGNVDLNPESGESITAGIVFSPAQIEGLTFYADYFDYDIEDFITTLGAQTILDGCASSGVFCDLIQRVPTGNVVNIINTATNVGGIETSGWDFAMDYRIPFFKDYGDFGVTWDLQYIDEYTQFNPDPATGGLTPDVNVKAGRFVGTSTPTAIPRVKSNLRFDWGRGDWGATLTFRYIGEMEEDCTDGLNPSLTTFGLCSRPNEFDSDGNPLNDIDATVYTDAQVTLQLPGFNTQLTAGARNLLNEDPPISFNAFANSFDPSMHEIPGVFGYVQLKTEF